MLWLWLSMALSAGNFLLFRGFDRWQVDTRLAVAVNYVFCVLLGLISMPAQQLSDFHWELPWVPAAFVIGFLYVALFVLIGQSARVLGVNITTVASKMSFVVPMFAAFLYAHPHFDWRAWSALVSALLAVWWQSTGAGTRFIDGGKWLYPLLIFLGGGVADALLQYTEAALLPPNQQAMFLTSLFATAGCFGWVAVGWLRWQGNLRWSMKALGAGALLGVTNFSAVYTLLKAFRSGLPHAFIFPMLNVGILLLASLAAALLFAERPQGKQWWGLLSALGAILLYASRL